MSGRPLKIAIEGNIAAGKSTFLELVNKHTPFKTLQETVDDWTGIELASECAQTSPNNLLHNFYTDPSRWALTFQQYVVFSRVKAMREDKHPQGSYLTERSVWGDRLVFARNLYKQGHMTALEYSLYCHQHSFCVKECPGISPDAILYMRTSPDICYERLRSRAREEESEVKLEYLQQIHNRHEEWLIHKSIDIPEPLQNIPVLVVDCSKNFISDSVYREELIDQLKGFSRTILVEAEQ